MGEGRGSVRHTFASGEVAGEPTAEAAGPARRYEARNTFVCITFGTSFGLTVLIDLAYRGCI